MMMLPSLWNRLLREQQSAAPSDVFGSVWRRFAGDCGLTVVVAVLAVLISELVSTNETLAGGLSAALVDFGFRFFVAMMVVAILLRPRKPASGWLVAMMPRLPA